MRCLIFLLLLFHGVQGLGQDIPDQHADVVAQVQRINHTPHLTEVVLDNEEWLPQAMDGGAQLTGYYRDTEIQKIVRWVGYSYGNEQFVYYFQHGQLFFIYETLDEFYLDSTGVRQDSTQLNFIGRYYFRAGKLYDHETTGHNRFEDDAVDIQGTLLREAREAFAALEAKRKRQLRSKGHGPCIVPY